MIAAINGAAAGLGLVEALYCDVRFAVPSAKFTSSFAKRGLIAEYGVAWLLPRVVGASSALDLLMSARVVTGEEAYRIGLVDFLDVQPDVLVARAVEYAEELATSCSPSSMATIKAQVFEGLDSDFPTALKRANGATHASFDGADVGEGVASYLQRRPPKFASLRRADSLVRDSRTRPTHRRMRNAPRLAVNARPPDELRI